jgi:hypothetical protein
VDSYRRTNSLAIAALVCGILQNFIPFTGIAAIICGHMAKSQIRRTGEDGWGLATAGLILGYIGLAFALLVLLLIVIPPARPTG